MEITQTPPAGAPASPIRAEPTMAASTASDFQTFLTLLIAQMRNQDPLEPTASTEFVAQLATFSGVEQQVRANEKLDLIFTALMGGGASAAGLAEWIGREVRAPVAANFKGVPIDVELPRNPQADSSVLVVRNAFDQVIFRRTLPDGQTAFTWEGGTDLGTTAPHGTYRFEVESYKNDTLIDTQPGWVYAAVTEVRIADGGARLVLEGGDTTPVTAVTGVR